MIGTSGTINAINDVAKQRGAVDGLTPAALTDITKALITARRIDQVSLENLPGERTPVIPGGVAILRGVFEGLGIERLTVSSGALREGLLQELIGRVRHEDVREHSVADLAHRYHVDEPHAQNVARYSADAARAGRSRVGSGRRRMRTAVAVGRACCTKSAWTFHTASTTSTAHYLLQYMDLAGFSQTDKMRLALLVRAHRRKFPVLEFERIDADERTTLVRLARVAAARGSVAAQSYRRAAAADRSAGRRRAAEGVDSRRAGSTRIR